MAASDDEAPTCGKGIAASAALPEKLAAFMRATAEMLQSHVRALDLKEAAGKEEADAYHRLVAEHHALGDGLEALAGLMRGYHDLPVASHDMDVLMDRRSLEGFAAMVSREEVLLAELQERVSEHKNMLAMMGPDA